MSQFPLDHTMFIYQARESSQVNSIVESQNMFGRFTVEGMEGMKEWMAANLTMEQLDNLLKSLDHSQPDYVEQMKTIIEIKHLKVNTGHQE